MGLMPTMPMSRPLTVEDFEAIRDVDDGHRYELIDGSLVVTPSLVPIHQAAVTELLFLLRGSAPAGMRVFVAPLDVRFGADTVLQPDVLVVPRSAIGERRLEGGPVLAVEVLSPSTRHIDLGLKLSRYEAAGTPSYWVIDPHEPSLRVWDLRDGRYVQSAHVVGGQVATLSLPWSLQITPSTLVDDLR